MKAILYIVAPVPIGLVISWLLVFIAFLWPSWLPTFFWTLLVSTCLVLFLYTIYKCWKIAWKDVLEGLRR